VPGSPRRMGLFLLRLARICVTLMTSLSRPTTWQAISTQHKKRTQQHDYAAAVLYHMGSSKALTFQGVHSSGERTGLTGSNRPCLASAHRSLQ
jgi:hypothetical protein